MSIEELKAKLAELKAKLAEAEEGEEDPIEAEIATVEADLAKAEAANDDTGDEDDSMDAKVEKLAEAKLAKMKANMDKMAEKLAKAEKDNADSVTAQKAEKMKRLEDEGKLTELAEMRATEAEAKVKVVQDENTQLKRDGVVNTALNSLEFKNDRSREMVRKDVIDQLAIDEDGNWTHKSGKSITEFVQEYSKDTDNEFLFRAKTNSGGGKTTNNGTSDTNETKKISEMTSEEILKLAAKGKLGSYNV
jgi:hypothetical protein